MTESSSDTDNPWKVTIDLRSFAIGMAISIVALVALSSVASAGPYLSAECSEDGYSFTNPDPSLSHSDMNDICEERQDAIHPVLYDVKLGILGVVGEAPYPSGDSDGAVDMTLEEFQQEQASQYEGNTSS